MLLIAGPELELAAPDKGTIFKDVVHPIARERQNRI